jgi:hypothetical protein
VRSILVKNNVTLLVASILLGACTSTPPRAVLLKGNIVMIEGGYTTVPTPEGSRPWRDGGCMKFKLIGDKDEYLPGEIYFREGCYGDDDDISLITSHYRGSIRLDRKKSVVIVAIYFAEGTALRQNGKYKYVEE